MNLEDHDEVRKIFIIRRISGQVIKLTSFPPVPKFPQYPPLSTSTPVLLPQHILDGCSTYRMSPHRVVGRWDLMELLEEGKSDVMGMNRVMD
jgi:hypothetical protein